MINKRLSLSFYDTNVGEYDEYNPRYVRNKHGVPEILYMLAENAPYSLSCEDIINKLDIDNEECKNALDSLIKINAISIREDKYKINFPAFIEKDIELLGDFNIIIGKLLGEKIISLKDEIDHKISKLSCYRSCDVKVLRYHTIGCSTLDGGAMDYFTEKRVIATSKLQPGNRDYIIIGNEENEKMHDYSDKLLCNCNIWRTGNIGFRSFGDGDGERKDMMRFFRRIQDNLEKATEHKDLNMAYIKLNAHNNEVIVKKCGELLLKVLKEQICYNNLKKEEKDVAVFLKELGYFDFKDEYSEIKCAVPVFSLDDKMIIDEISDLITLNIYEIVKQAFATLDRTIPGLTSIKHGVEIRDIANELWHLMFGATNEYLVKAGFYAEPEYKKGEGRYFKCICIE